MNLVWVAGLSRTYTIGDKSYGPSEKPIQVPEGLAGALELREVDAPEEAESTEVGGITLLGETQAALRTVVKAQEQIAELFPQFGPGDILTTEDGAHPLVEAVKQLKADSVSRAEYDRVVSDSQSQGLKLAEVTTERNEALAREQSKSEANQQLTTERDDLKQQLETMTGYRDTAVDDVNAFRAQISDLQAQLATQADGETAKPGDTDQRTKAELKAALDGKGVTYAPNLNRDGLLALAAEHGA